MLGAIAERRAELLQGRTGAATAITTSAGHRDSKLAAASR